MDFDLILQNVKKHIQLNKAEENLFISLLDKKEIKKKSYLLKQNEICKTESFIIKGYFLEGYIYRRLPKET